MYSKIFKRFFDFMISLIGLIVLSPVFLIVYILVYFKLGSPVIFKQKRPGLNNKIFTMYKFRSMTDAKDKNGNLLSDEIRLTKFGKTLRNTSLDELPELINILKGDMSIVGPRPQLVRDLVFMSKKEQMRHSVRPGLTGLAQINGRNNISWEQKFKYDLEYLKNITLLGDLKIFLKTFIKTAASEGINTDGMATAEDLGDYLLRTNKITYNEYVQKQEEANNLLRG